MCPLKPKHLFVWATCTLIKVIYFWRPFCFAHMVSSALLSAYSCLCASPGPHSNLSG